MKLYRYIYIALSASLLTSCGLYKNYERNEEQVQAEVQHLYRDPMAENAPLTVTDSVCFGNTPWREVFTDPVLQSHIEKALAQNGDIAHADLTLQQAEVGLRINKLAFLPQIAFTPSGTLAKAFIDGTNTTATYEFPIAASWQLDAFGLLRNQKKQGEMTVLQAQAAKQATQTAIICAMANMYYSLQMLDEQLSTTKATLALWDKNITAMEAMMQAGMTNAASVSSAKAQHLQIQTTIPAIEGNIREVENAMCLIMDETPHAISRNAFTADGFPASFSTGMPIQLLEARPDVKIAELTLAKAFYGVNAAKASFYPQITISGQGAWTNSLGGIIMNPGKFLAAGVASLTQPIFAQGKLKGQLEIAEIAQKQAELDFSDALLKAGSEVSNALAAYNTAVEQTRLCEQQVAELEKANEATDFLFHNGNTTSYLETLTAQMNLLNGRLALINNRYAKVQAVVSLYQALGGGRE